MVLLEISLFILEKKTKARIDKVDVYSSNVETRIISIGESTTYGVRVEKDETYTYLLDKRVGEKIKIYNLGIYGITSSTVLRNFEKNIIKIKPAIAIINIGNNDFSSSLSQQNTILDSNLPISITKILYKFRVYKLYKLLIDKNKYKNYLSGSTDEIGQKYLISQHDSSIDSTDDWNFFSHAATQLIFNINEIIKLAEMYNVELIFVGYFSSIANKYLNDYFFNSTIPFVKLDVDNYKQYLSKDNFHPNAEGHKYIANEIFKELRTLNNDT